MVARLKNLLASRFLGVVVIGLLLLFWQVTAVYKIIDTVSWQPISTILVKWYQIIITRELLAQLVPSLIRMAVGYGLATVMGVGIGMAMGTNRMVYNALEPLMEVLRPIPAPTYIPIAILFLGLGDEMKIFIITLASFFPILLNTYSGVRGIDTVLINTGRTFGFSQGEIMRKIVFPASLPNIFTGMRISLGISLIMIVISEMVAANSGIGFYILQAQRNFQVSVMYAGIFTLGALGYLLNRLFLTAERKILHWHTSAAREEH